MSGKRKRDYKKVLKAIKCMTRDRKLEKYFVVDFESAMWRAIQDALVCGCSFHWSQCIWRKIQDIGLAPAYKHDNATHKLCRQFLAPPYLPKEHIAAMFENLATKAATPMLTELVTYIRINWIEGHCGSLKHGVSLAKLSEQTMMWRVGMACSTDMLNVETCRST